MLEVHVTFSRQAFGPDVTSSITFPELKQLTEGAADIHRMRSSPVEKDALAKEMAALKGVFQKSIVARRAFKAGRILAERDLALKKAGGGLPPGRLSAVIGRRLARDVKGDVALTEADLTGGP
jgi:sialic acid synthase SpsE